MSMTPAGCREARERGSVPTQLRAPREGATSVLALQVKEHVAHIALRVEALAAHNILESGCWRTRMLFVGEREMKRGAFV